MRPCLKTERVSGAQGGTGESAFNGDIELPLGKVGKDLEVNAGNSWAWCESAGPLNLTPPTNS